MMLSRRTALVGVGAAALTPSLGLTACAPFGPGFATRFPDWAFSSA